MTRLLRPIAFLLLFVVALVVAVGAQQRSVDLLRWDQVADSLDGAQGFRYTAYFDGAVAGALVTATCTGDASPFACSAPLPALTQGPHTVQLTSGLVTPEGATVESEKAPAMALGFTVVIAPAAPANIRITR